MSGHSPFPEVQARACQSLLQILSDPGGQDQVMKEVGIAPLIKVMVGHPHSESVQADACKVLRELVKGREDIMQELTRSGGAEAISRAMRNHPSCMTILQDGVWVLQHLTMISLGRQRIALRGGIDDINSLLKNHKTNVEIQEASCSALGNLAFDQELRSLVGADSIEAVLESMALHPDDEGVQDGGAFMLHNLACDHHIAHTIKSLGGVQVLEHALDLHPAQDPSSDERVAALDLLTSLE